MAAIPFNYTQDITTLKHPHYVDKSQEWYKWRLSYESGQAFLTEYLERFSERELDKDFVRRSRISYVPAFAKAAVNEVKDSIFQRIVDVTRKGGTQSYQDAILGSNYGVDLKGSTMNSFIGREILPELLVMGKVGVYVDKPRILGNTIADAQGKSPYIYKYDVEDILNWVYAPSRDGILLKTLLLRDHIYGIDEITGLPISTEEQYRFYWIDEGIVHCQLFNESTTPQGDEVIIDLPAIPFVIFELSDSLMTDIADYQIALLNLASSDVSYVLKSNFPFYVEQFDPRSENLFNRPPSPEGVQIVQPGTVDDAVAAKAQEIRVGVASGRRISKGLDMPQFIYPSPEPLLASMKKQDEIKADIRELLKLTLTQLTPKMASVESKNADERSLEAGLSAIGLELEHGERQIARLWTLYEDKTSLQPTVNYPEQYSLQSNEEKRKQASDIIKSAKSIPSLTYKKAALKEAATILVGTKISLEHLQKIHQEIDGAKVIVSDPDELSKDIEQGIVSLETASHAKNYPDGEVDKASKDHEARIKRILESQTQARGVSDLSGLGNASKNEKMISDTSTTPTTDDLHKRGVGA
jgi:hypothetical protein